MISVPRHRGECHGPLLAEPRRQVREHRGVGSRLHADGVEHIRELLQEPFQAAFKAERPGSAGCLPLSGGSPGSGGDPKREREHYSM